MNSNTMNGISGLLVYDGSVFVQLVEGPEDALDELFDRIRHDDRHQAVNIVDDRLIEERSFPSWSMKLLRIDRAHMVGVEAAEQLMGPGVETDVRAMLLGVINRMDQLAG